MFIPVKLLSCAWGRDLGQGRCRRAWRIFTSVWAFSRGISGTDADFVVLVSTLYRRVARTPCRGGTRPNSAPGCSTPTGKRSAMLWKSLLVALSLAASTNAFVMRPAMLGRGHAHRECVMRAESEVRREAAHTLHVRKAKTERHVDDKTG
jgi:hypothetical protein